MMSISGLNHTAHSLAVYASQCRLPRHHARLASGCWPSSAGRGLVPRKVPSKGFRVTSLPPFPSGSWGQIDAWGYSQKDSQKFIGNGLDGKAPLEHRLVLSQVPLAHAVEPTEEVPNMRP